VSTENLFQECNKRYSEHKSLLEDIASKRGFEDIEYRFICPEFLDDESLCDLQEAVETSGNEIDLLLLDFIQTPIIKDNLSEADHEVRRTIRDTTVEELKGSEDEIAAELLHLIEANPLRGNTLGAVGLFLSSIKLENPHHNFDLESVQNPPPDCENPQLYKTRKYMEFVCIYLRKKYLY
jgi:hypothetical protein